ncbi:hypothetical protein SKAU_G00253850 [Synaphobranchus kaupii]|uniref:Uncharacterized protein n=1 Tax=Synaphobranchus kaupii TaxID=118154 RepID=A0A9Q1IS46_SYNKA|nr:hypothetical protein SKAU_G00253850 [Synaphobranchus kaupii]
MRALLRTLRVIETLLVKMRDATLAHISKHTYSHDVPSRIVRHHKAPRPCHSVGPAYPLCTSVPNFPCYAALRPFTGHKAHLTPPPPPSQQKKDVIRQKGEVLSVTAPQTDNNKHAEFRERSRIGTPSLR